MIDNDTAAARGFYRLVREFAVTTKPWETAIFHEVKPDEQWDITLISQRVYGRRDEYLAVMAAAGMDAPDTKLEQKRIVLPTDAQLYTIKRRAGFETRSEYRKEHGQPTWGR